MTCEECKSMRAPVPYLVHESAMARAERTQKRLWITIMMLIVLLVGSNCAWLYYESQFTEVEITQENEDGYNNFVGNDGDIYNGEANDQGSGS